MIHVLTVHWHDDRWVDIQLTYLHKHVQQPFKVYAFLNGLPQKHRAKYFYSCTEPIVEHAIKLNILADIAAFNTTEADDLLMFLDGDAFPVGEVVSFGREKLRQYPLIAVQRRENDGDIQPHPCFCLTTVRFWKAINGDWKEGYRWENPQGKFVTDVGGNLLGILKEKGIDWYPMLRSNKRNLHPVFFGLYEDLVYHHGASFRRPLSQVDVVGAGHRTGQGGLINRSFSRADMARISVARARLYRIIKWLLPAGRPSKLRAMLNPTMRIQQENRILIEQRYEVIKKDPLFYRYFQQSDQAKSARFA
jgi:hypothetical protein